MLAPLKEAWLYHSNIQPFAGEETCQQESAIVGKGKWAEPDLYSPSAPQHFISSTCWTVETEGSSRIAVEAAW